MRVCQFRHSPRKVSLKSRAFVSWGPATFSTYFFVRLKSWLPFNEISSILEKPRYPRILMEKGDSGKGGFGVKFLSTEHCQRALTKPWLSEIADKTVDKDGFLRYAGVYIEILFAHKDVHQTPTQTQTMPTWPAAPNWCTDAWG